MHIYRQLNRVTQYLRSIPEAAFSDLRQRQVQVGMSRRVVGDTRTPASVEEPRKYRYAGLICCPSPRYLPPGQANHHAALPPSMSMEEKHLRRIAQDLFRLDLCAAQTITEDFTPEERRLNVEPHFELLWKCPPRYEVIERWLDSDELYRPRDVIELPGLHEYLANLSYDQICEVINDTVNTVAHGFYIRMMEGRMEKLKKKNTSHRIAEQNLKAAFKLNLGLLIGEKPADEDEYLSRLTRNQFIAEARLSFMLREVRHFRYQVTRESKSPTIDERLLEGLQLRANALQLHYEEAWKQLGKEQHDLLDTNREAWR
jgi:hypothetical protein